MGVVHHAARMVGAADGHPLHPARDHRFQRHGPLDVGDGIPEAQEGDGSHRGVDPVEGAGKVTRDAQPLPARAEQVDLGVVARGERPVGLASRRDGDQRYAAPLGEPDPPVVVDADDPLAGPRWCEQPRLGLEVVGHVGVEVQMVLREVGEQRHVIAHPVDPVLSQGVAGDLHDDRVGPPLVHDRKDRVQVGGLRGGADRGQSLVADACLHRADESGASAQCAQR